MKVAMESVPPVYNVARQLRLQLQRSTQKAPVNDKRGIVFDTEIAVNNLMKATMRANRCADNAEGRLAFIQESSGLIEDIELNVRIMFDLHIIKDKGFAQLVRIEDDVRAQLYGWRRTTAAKKDE